MSSNNKSDDAVGSFIMIGIAFAGAAILIAMVAVVFLATFAAFVLTILAIIAWNKPLRIGPLDIQPDQARAFVLRGLIGAALVPMFIGFTQLVFGLAIDWSFWFYFVLGGYVVASVGVELGLAEEGQSTHASEPAPPQTTLNVTPRLALPKPAPGPFHYASWDEEEGR